MMKKEYIVPEFEVYKLKMQGYLMAGSTEAPVDDSQEEFNENAL